MCHLHQDLFMYIVVKCTRIRKIDLLEKKASNEKILLFIIDLFFHVEVPPLHLYYRHRDIYIYTYISTHTLTTRAYMYIYVLFPILSYNYNSAADIYANSYFQT